VPGILAQPAMNATHAIASSNKKVRAGAAVYGIVEAMIEVGPGRNFGAATGRQDVIKTMAVPQSSCACGAVEMTSIEFPLPGWRQSRLMSRSLTTVIQSRLLV
jgi:hypothetical protein